MKTPFSLARTATALLLTAAINWALSAQPTHAAGRTPLACAGDDVTVEGGTAVVLDGTYSWDAEGDPLQYSWTQTEGPVVALNVADPSHPSFTAPTPGQAGVAAENQVLAFKLTVSDGTSVSAASEVRIMVLKPFDPVKDGPAVITTSDPNMVGGAGTLLNALQYAENNPGTRITFNLSPSDPGYDPISGFWTVPHRRPAMVWRGVTIDGFSQRTAPAAANAFITTAGVPVNIACVGNDFYLGWWSSATSIRNVVRGLSISALRMDNIADTVLSGCYLKTGPLGNGTAGTTGSYIQITGGSNIRIGGASPDERNLLRGSLDFSTITFPGTNSVKIVGNFIGLDRTGTQSLGSGMAHGLIFSDSTTRPQQIQVGGVTPGSRNVIAGFSRPGQVFFHCNLSNPTSRLVIQGNYFGTDVSGVAGLPNAQGCELRYGAANIFTQIGGAQPGAGNVFASCGTWGGIVVAADVSRLNMTIQGNIFGLGADGMTSLPNQTGMTFMNLTEGALIGGTGPGERNIFSSNVTNGLTLSGSYDSYGGACVVRGNLIGVAADGVTPRGNGQYGIAGGHYSSPVFVGGTAPGEGNVIAYNGKHGVTGGRASRFAIRGNSIFNNNGLGIGTDVSMSPLANNTGDGPMANTANLGRNYPELISAAYSNGSTTITGRLDTVPGLNVTIDFYANTVGDPSGHGEGERYIGSHSFTAGSGFTPFTTVLPIKLPANTIVAATTTDSSGNTSEFSRFVVSTYLNSPPLVANPGDQTDTEATSASLQITALDYDADPIVFSASGLPLGLTIHPLTGSITGDLDYDAAGSYNVTVGVSDGVAQTTVAFVWSVTNTNRAPILTTPDDQEDAEGETVSLQVEGIDPDGDALTYSASGLPDGLTIDAATGIISGSLSYDAAGTHAVTVSVSDGMETVEAAFVWTVRNTNRAPVLTDPGEQTNAEGETVSLAIAANDPDADTLSYSATGLPGGLSIDAQTGIISGTLPFTAAGNYPVSIAVSDGDLQAMAGFTWTVSNVNLPPSLLHPGNQAHAEGDNVLLQLSGSDPDEGTVLSYSATGLPPGLSLDSANGLIMGVPAYDSAGTYVVTITVSDGFLTAMQQFAWSVTDTNRPPVLINPGDQTGAEGDFFSLQLTASDPDGNPLSYSAIGLPPGITINPSTGEISGLLSYATAGIYEVTVAVSDGMSTVSQTFICTITNANRAPLITNPGDQTTAEGATVSLPIVADDPDGDALTFSALGLPAGLSIDATTGIINGTLPMTSAGAYEVTVSATDGLKTSSVSFTIGVTHTVTNRPPVASNSSVSTYQNTPVTLQLAVADPDGDALLISIQSPPLHGTLSAAEGNTIVYTPYPTWTGSDSFTFIANDGTVDSNIATVSISVGAAPPLTPGSKVTGGGTIAGLGGSSNFGFQVLIAGNGRLQGELTYHDFAANELVKAASITSLVVSNDGKHATIYGAARVNGSGSYRFIADVDDLAEPGARVDKFRITIDDGYSAGGTVTTGGNIQIHRK